MENISPEFKRVTDLTTIGMGVITDAEALVFRRPRVVMQIPGLYWHGTIGKAKAILRLPEPERWNGRILIGATPAVRTEQSLDLLLSDIALQQGYAFAACDKGTPLLTLRDPERRMTEWVENYLHLTSVMKRSVSVIYGQEAERTYISGVSNGGYITRRMMELYPEEYDGGVEWEGVYWHPEKRHLLTCLPTYLAEFPVYRNFRGDRTPHEQSVAFDRLVEAGLHPDSAPHWDQYFYSYWVVSLWLYGHNLDPTWDVFQSEWSNDWLKDPSQLANYPWNDRKEILQLRIDPIANSGRLTKPLISVAGNWDCLVPYRFHAELYAEAVQEGGFGTNHRLYEVERGNHVDGLLREAQGQQQPVLPYYEAALAYIQNWVEHGVHPPVSGSFENIEAFAPSMELFSMSNGPVEKPR